MCDKMRRICAGGTFDHTAKLRWISAAVVHCTACTGSFIGMTGKSSVEDATPPGLLESAAGMEIFLPLLNDTACDGQMFFAIKKFLIM